MSQKINDIKTDFLGTNNPAFALRELTLVEQSVAAFEELQAQSEVASKAVVTFA